MSKIVTIFPIGSSVKVIKKCVFTGKVGRVVEYHYDPKEGIEVELEFDKEHVFQGRSYKYVGTMLPLDYLEIA